MKIIDIANRVDELFTCDEFHFDIIKCASVSTIKITATNKKEIEFCRVGSVIGVKIDDKEIEISFLDADKILSPYIGKRLSLQLLS